MTDHLAPSVHHAAAPPSEILDELSPACRRALLSIGEELRLTAGEVVLAEGEICRSLFLLVQGRVKMSRSLATGRSVTLALYGPGELFGAVAALGGRPCDAALTALEDGCCREIPAASFYELLERQPWLTSELIPALTRRLAECNNCLVELTCFRVEMRLAHLLLKLSYRLGVEQQPGGLVMVPLRLSRQELADMTGTTVESSIRVMSAWHKEGIVETLADGFLIRDRSLLEQRAGL